MNIGLIDVDGKGKYPNLALMKICRYHREKGDKVEWYSPFSFYDKVYMSKVFTFTPDFSFPIINAKEIEKGGTGYDIHKILPPYIDGLQPDYSLYSWIENTTAYGFLTRGCKNKCKWCIVPKKEGAVRPYMDIEEIVIEGRRKVILMDNNILASDYGINQLKKIAQMDIHVDFNQGLDARLVTPAVANILAKIKWIRYIRFGCDTQGQVADCKRAMAMINEAGYHGCYFLYTIIIGLEESYKRISEWRNNKKVVVHAQPYRDFSKTIIIPQWQKDMAHWADRKEIYKTTDFKDFSPRKNFSCREYFRTVPT